MCEAAASLVHRIFPIDEIRTAASLRHTEWQSGSGSPNAGDVPTAQNVPAQVRTGERSGSLIEPVGGNVVRHITRREAALDLYIVEVFTQCARVTKVNS